MPTIGLSLIAHPSDYDDLSRCLQSVFPADKPRLIDTGHITVAAATDDPRMHTLIAQYGLTSDFFPWIFDFAAARNHAKSKLQACDYCLWLDCDDVVKPESYDALLSAKSTLIQDCYILPYNYNHDDKDRVVLKLPRERLIRVGKMEWHDEIHEWCTVAGLTCEKLDIPIDHYRTKTSGSRNIDILRLAVSKRPDNARLRFYFAKELNDNGNIDESIPLLQKVVACGEGYADNIVIACIKLAQHYLSRGNLEMSRRYALIGRGYSSLYAELDCVLGMIAENECDYDAAQRWYDEALTKRMGTAGMSQLAEYYSAVPNGRLSVVHAQCGRVEHATKCWEIAHEIEGDSKRLIEIKAEIEKLHDDNIKTRVMHDGEMARVKRVLEKEHYNLIVDSERKGVAVCKLTRKKSLDLAFLAPDHDNHSGVYRIRYGQIINNLSSVKPCRVIKSLKELLPETNCVVLTQGMHHLAPEVKKLGIDCVIDLCESILDDRIQYLMMADLITVCSTELQQALASRGIHHTYVIRDAYEQVNGHHKYNYDREKPIALYIGYGGNAWMASSWLRSTVESAGYQLQICSEWDDADVRWDLNNWSETMSEADVIIIPQRHKIQPCKSNNRLTQAMSMGLPCICSPLPAYLEVAKHDVNCFVADSLTEWYNALIALKDHATRIRIGTAAKASVDAYHVSVISGIWFGICNDLINKYLHSRASIPIMQSAAEPIDIIIPTYGQPEYLKLCLESIWLETDIPYRIIISDAGSDAEMWKYLNGLKTVTVIGKEGVRKNFSEAVNDAIRIGTCRFFAIVNSDVIVSAGWLTRLLRQMLTVPRLATCNGLSNCDVGWRYKPGEHNMVVNNNLTIHPGMKLEQVKPHLEDLRKFMAASNCQHHETFMPVDWTAFYCTLIARSVVNECGLLDPEFKSGCEDLDLCNRMSTAGYKHGHALDAFVFHFGGVSRGAHEKEDNQKYREEDVHNHQLLKRKWEGKRIAIWTGASWEQWDREKVMSGMGGSETWACELAAEFAKHGWDTTLYADTRKDEYMDEGVRWVHWDAMQKDLQYRWYDHFIASRDTAPLTASQHSTKCWLMIHDVFILGGQQANPLLWKINGYACLSDWHKGYVSTLHRIPEDKIFLTNNGVRQELYANPLPKTNSAVWSSSLDRGCIQLLQMLPEIVKAVPDFKLHICYGTWNWEASAKQMNDVAGLLQIKKIKQMIADAGDSVVYHDRVSKVELARLQLQAKVWLQPTWFLETFCIGAVENGLAGNALLSTALGGLTTTIGPAGLLLPSAGVENRRDTDYDKSYTDQFVSEAVRLLTDEEYRLTWANLAQNKMQNYTWEAAYQSWVNRF